MFVNTNNFLLGDQFKNFNQKYMGNTYFYYYKKKLFI